MKDIMIGENVTNLKNPVIEGIFDVHTNEISDKISAGHSIQLFGSRLKVAGSKDDIGVFFAPCDETGAYGSDYSKWIRIGAERIVNNTISLLMFELPNSVVAGSYRIIVQTAYGSGKRVNKSVKCGVYDKIVNVR